MMNGKEKIVSSLLGSLVMASIMSGFITGMKFNFSVEWLLEVWPNAFITAWPVALLLNLILIPRIMVLSKWLTKRVTVNES